MNSDSFVAASALVTYSWCLIEKCEDKNRIMTEAHIFFTELANPLTTSSCTRFSKNIGSGVLGFCVATKIETWEMNLFVTSL